MNINSVLPGVCESSLISFPPNPAMFVNVPSSNKILSPAFVELPSVPFNVIVCVLVPTLTATLGIACLRLNLSSNTNSNVDASIGENVVVLSTGSLSELQNCSNCRR